MLLRSVLNKFVLSFSLENETAMRVIRKGIIQRFEFVNFQEDKFFFLNITALVKRVVEDSLSCAFSCLDKLACFSFNFAAFPDKAGKFVCEILSSDKYSNSENFLPSKVLHHFSIVVRNLRLLFRQYLIRIWEGMTLGNQTAKQRFSLFS